MKKFWFLLAFFSNHALAQKIIEKEISFASNEITLHGKIVMPEGKTKMPAIVFLVGSGKSSYQTNYAPLINEIVNKIFIEKGFAILYFDKRGIGKSTGNWQECSFQDRADDAYAAVNYLKSLSEIDKTKIGVMGHSQGGWIAQLAASQHRDIKFAISLAGPVTSVKEQIIGDEMSMSVCKGIDSTVAKQKAEATWDELSEKSKDAKEGDLLQFLKIKDYTPDAALRKIKCPILLLFGGNDRIVPEKLNRERLKQIFGKKLPHNFNVETISGALHSFRLGEVCYAGQQKDLKYADDLVSRLKNWKGFE